MQNSDYSLRYLPKFYEDLEQIVIYIGVILKNVKAANDFLDAVELVIKKRLPFAESFEPYTSIKKRKYPYYRIYVGNYTIFYVVIVEDGERIMEVRRIIYSKRDVDNEL